MSDVYPGKATCKHCGEGFPFEQHLVFHHLRTKHPDIWTQILKEVEEENRS